ncbi:LytR C-terminal domain-containing protein [Nocardioides sp.]|uniref:LytR C-terminal domain-containing protein n=1 Tax=Nocardioides sp. TaxID=35761 RepID=UPI002EDB3DEF
MAEGARSAITLAALAVLLVLGAVWGWSALTDPLPAKVDRPLCVDTTVEAGTKVYAQDVTVSVYNAGTREGLAGRTMQLLSDDGFAEGSMGNVRARVARVAIWTLEPENPAVRLVASRLGPDVDIERREGPGVGVAVVVGDGFDKLAKGRRSIVAAEDATICSPPVD